MNGVRSNDREVTRRASELMSTPLLERYIPIGIDEMVAADGRPRASHADLIEKLARWGPDEFRRRQSRADLALLNAGITCTVYADKAGTERVFLFSLVPRIVDAVE